MDFHSSVYPLPWLWRPLGSISQKKGKVSLPPVPSDMMLQQRYVLPRSLEGEPGFCSCIRWVLESSLDLFFVSFPPILTFSFQRFPWVSPLRTVTVVLLCSLCLASHLQVEGKAAVHLAEKCPWSAAAHRLPSCTCELLVSKQYMLHNKDLNDLDHLNVLLFN